MANVLFSKMTAAKFATITPDNGTFYRVTDGANQDFYLGSQKLNNTQDITNAINALSANGGAIYQIQQTLNTIQGDAETSGSIAYAIAQALAGLADVATSGAAADVTVADAAENFDGVTTGEGQDAVTTKTVENILAELAGKITTAGTNGAVSMTTANGDAGSNIARIYTFYQGAQIEANKIGVINLPADMFGTSGSVVTIAADADPEDIPTGCVAGHTYLQINIANGGDTVYIDVGNLIEYVTGSDNNVINVSVDSTTHVVSATIDTGAIVNTMIADGTIAKTKLTQAVQDTLDAADSAVQSVANAGANEGSDGSIKVVTGTGTNATTSYVIPKNLKSVATTGMSDDVLYKEAVAQVGEEGDPNYVAPQAAVTVEEALDDIYSAFGNGGNVTTQITNAINTLDSSVSATTEANNRISVLTGVTETDGKLTAKTESLLSAVAKTGTSDDVQYKAAVAEEGTQGEAGYVAPQAAVSVKDALDDIYGKVGNTSVADQITNALTWVEVE